MLNFFCGISQETKRISLIFKDSESGEFITNLHLSIQNSDKIFTTSEDGIINIPCIGSEIKFFASHLGYAAIDTSISCNVSRDTSYFLVKPNPYRLPEIGVFTNEPLKKKDNITIFHTEYINGDLCVFYKREDTSIVSTFSSNWLKNDKRLAGEIKEIYRLDNSEHVYIDVGNEIQMHTYTADSFIIARRIKHNQIERMKNVIGKHEDYWVYVNYKNFNQSIEVICHNRRTNSHKILYTIENEEGIHAANVYFRDLIKQYSLATNDDENAIDEGFSRSNVLDDTAWDGDLKDLIINNEMHTSVDYFQNVVAHPIDKFLIHVSNSGSIGIFDGYKSEIIGIDLKKGKVMDKLNFIDSSIGIYLIPSCSGDTAFERAGYLYTFNGANWRKRKINDNGCIMGRILDCDDHIRCLDDVIPLLTQ